MKKKKFNITFEITPNLQKIFLLIIIKYNIYNNNNIL